MLLARVTGTVVATRKDERLVSNKLLVVRPVDPAGKAEGSSLVAVDTVDAALRTASRDGEIRLTYAELTALIADAVKNLRD